MKTLGIKTCLAFFIFLTALPVTTSASDDRKGPPPGPPPEAIKACEGKNAGDKVEFDGPRGETFTGICREINGQLAAAPEGMPPGDRPERR